MNNFYCQKKCGGSDYKQGQINETIADCKGMNFSPEEIKQVVRGVHQSFEQRCTEQCKTCKNIVAETQLKNKALGGVVKPTKQ